MNDPKCDNDLSMLVFDDWDDFGEETNNTLSKNVINVSHFNASSSCLDTSNRLDVSALCCDEELNGFDRNAGPTWIYPTNYSVRDYQYNIVKAALFKNTLVSLPTGLGKTFIAAVVMYNYYRWYPLGKIIFVAPTRPLVAQQIEACYNITAIPPPDTIEMTGSMQTAARKIAWQTKRVIFATPQVVHNDLESGACPGALVRCLVIDEAHRARGRHSYCQLVEALDLRGHALYRVLALSATPGSKVEDVINVVQNLHIAHLELRSENCIDVAMYSHARSMQTIVVPLGDDLTGIRQRYIEILDIYTRRLVQYKILTGNVGNFSKGRIIMLFKEYQNIEKSMRHPQHQTIMRDFTMVITLFHALELLTKHGARVFLNFFDDHPNKVWVGRDDNLTCFLERLRDDLGTNPFSVNKDTLPDGTVPEITENLKFGHPKFDHLREVMVNHFNTAKSKGQETKAIVFCEYRESVHLVHCLLLQCRPAIRPHMFIGQGLGSSGSSKDQTMKPFSQKQQLRVMKMFREGSCNVLVSTSVGEEGLDVGNVDLIICFDISNKSPVRLVQRCGRTGRERGGRVVILVTEGKEHQTLRDCIMQRDSLNKRVMQSKELLKNLFTANPRMIPNNLKPQCQKMFITVIKKKEIEEKPKKVQSKIKDLLKKQFGGDGKNPAECAAQNSYLSNEEYLAMYANGLPTFNFFPEQSELWNSSKSAILSTDDEAVLKERPDINLCEWMEWQRKLQFSVTVDHSVDSEMFTELLQYADTKRFNMPPSTQNPSFAKEMFATQIETPKPNKSPIKKGKASPIKKNKTSPLKKTKILNPPKKKHVDIRDLFNRQNKDEEQILFEAKLKETFEDYGLAADDTAKNDKLLEKENISSVLIELMVEFNIEKTKNKIPEEFSKYFNIYPKKTKCLLKPTPSGLTSSWTLPNTDIIEDIRDAKNVDFQTIIPPNNDLMTSPIIHKPKLVLPNKTTIMPLSQPTVKNSSQPTVMDLPPSPIMEISQEIYKEIQDSSPENQNTSMILSFKKNEADFDIGDIDDIFADSCSPKENISIKKNLDFHIPDKSELELVKMKNPLNFFGLDDIEDIFVDSEETKNGIACKNSIHISPKANTSHISSHSDESQSPILGSQWNKSNFKNSTVNASKNITNLSPIASKITKDASVIPNNNINFTKNKENLNNSFLRQPNGMLNGSVHNESVNSKSVDRLQNKSNCNMNNTTLFTVTQIIDILNDPEELENKNKCGKEKQSKFNSIDKESSEDSNHSLILCSQIPKKKVVKKSVHKSKPHLTILETSESSSDESIKNGFDNHRSRETGFNNTEIIRQNKLIVYELKNDSSFKSIPCTKDSYPPSKRKLNSSDESNEFSPFFKKKAISNQTSNANNSPIRPKALSLKEKLALRRIKTNNVVTHCISSDDDDFCFKDPNVSAHFKNSTKECPNPKNIHSRANSSKNSDFGKVLNTQINHVSQLSQFTKPSQPQWLGKQSNQCVSSSSTKSKYIQEIKNSSSKPASDSDNDFEPKLSAIRRLEPKNRREINLVKPTKKKGKLPRSEFIHFEAELSDDSYEGSSDENEISKSGEEQDTSIVQFLCDEDHIEQDESVDMQAKYLQSVRSPVKSHGKFKIPILPRKPSTISVFSQVDPDEHATYELDSFVVDCDNDLLTQRHDMSELEIAEAILKRRKRRKRKGKLEDTPPKQCDDPAGNSPIAKNKRKRAYFRIDSESSTDEDLFA